MPKPTSPTSTQETPEKKARRAIDALFSSAGWQVVPRGEYSPVISAAAIEEGLLKGGLETDYLLFLDGKAIGVLEAKSESTKLGEIVAKQAENYTHQLLNWYPYWEKPLPLIYLSNGRELLFKNTKRPEDGYKPLSRMHSPAEMAELAGIKSYFTGLPALSRAGLRHCQYEAVKALEDSFRAGSQRALIVLATGAGKTYTACLAAYRLLTYTPARRILFLVDRNNLGIQAESEFGTFRLTESGDAFNLIYTTVRLKNNKIPQDTNLAICTIQRLFSVLTGTELQDSDDDESGEDDDQPEVSLEGKQLLIPHDFFDAIIVDECHRSIYGRWKKVLEYFHRARIVGLTATPAPETLVFFHNNLVVNYTLGHSIADGINVDGRTYRIKTEATTHGGVIQEGEEYRSKTKYTGKETLMVAEETVPYMASQLNRSVVNPAQIQLVLETFRDAVYTDMFVDRVPDFASLPKTLIFAENESHAVEILRILREKVFPGQHPDFAQKITCQSGNTDALIRKFRNDRNFRIAVTVTLVATGTDVKPLEILLFMRDVASENLFIQMKGRGVRCIGDGQLQNVTPQTRQKDGRPISKECFYLVDAVGVTEHGMLPPGAKGGESGFHLSLEMLLEQIAHGYLPDDNLRLLASRLPRIHGKAEESQRAEFLRIAGVTLSSLSQNIYHALESGILPEFKSSNDPNPERKALVAPLAQNPEARRYLLELSAGFVKTLLPGEDTLISSGFTLEEAEATTKEFEEYLQQLRDSDEAVRIIAANSSEPIPYEMLSELAKKLAAYNYKFRFPTLWNDYQLLRPDAVVPLKDRKEREAMTCLIQLVRFAFKSMPRLRSLTSQAAQRFELWCGQTQRHFSSLSPRQKEILQQIASYVVSNGTCTRKALSQTYGLQIVAAATKEFGTLNTVDELLMSLSAFLLAA